MRALCHVRYWGVERTCRTSGGTSGFDPCGSRFFPTPTIHRDGLRDVQQVVQTHKDKAFLDPDRILGGFCGPIVLDCGL